MGYLYEFEQEFSNFEDIFVKEEISEEINKGNIEETMIEDFINKQIYKGEINKVDGEIALTINDIIEIAKNIIIKNGYDENEFEKIKIEILRILDDKFKMIGIIYSMESLSKNICSKIEHILIKKDLLNENIHQIKSEIAIILNQNKIIRFIELLKKIEKNGKWSQNSILQNPIYTIEEKQELVLILKWFRKNIRTYSEKNNKGIVSWKRILEELEKNGELTLAQNFNHRTVIY